MALDHILSLSCTWPSADSVPARRLHVVVHRDDSRRHSSWILVLELQESCNIHPFECCCDIMASYVMIFGMPLGSWSLFEGDDWVSSCRVLCWCSFQPFNTHLRVGIRIVVRFGHQGVWILNLAEVAVLTDCVIIVLCVQPACGCGEQSLGSTHVFFALTQYALAPFGFFHGSRSVTGEKFHVRRLGLFVRVQHVHVFTIR